MSKDGELDARLSEPQIEDRDEDIKPLKEVIEDLKGKSFAEEVQQDTEKVEVYIDRAPQAEKVLGADHPIAQQEKAAVGVYKRAMLLVGSSGLEVQGDTGEKKSAAENGLPTASYLAHGSRVMVEIPAGSGDRLINWLTSGSPETDGRSTKYDQHEALEEGKVVYSRLAATHDVDIKRGADGEFKLTEKKTGVAGFVMDIGRRVIGKRRHFGVDLALDAEFGGTDSQGKHVTRPDGDHGHMYMHYIPPTATTPGSLLLGVEGAAPSSSKHSKTGATDPISATGGSKIEDFAVKQKLAGEPEYQDTVVPQKYGGMIIRLDNLEQIEQIVRMDDRAYGSELARTKPTRSPAEFQAKLAAGDYHRTPELREARRMEPHTSKPSIVQKLANTVVNVITFSRKKPYQVEIDAYTAEQEVLKVYDQIQKKDSERLGGRVVDHPRIPTIDPKVIEIANSIGEHLRQPTATPLPQIKVASRDRSRMM